MTKSEDHQDDASQGFPTILKLDAQSAVPIRELFSAEHSPRLVKRDVLRHVRQVQDRLNSSEELARQVIEDARQEADAIRQQAREEAKQEVLAEMLTHLERARCEYDRLLQDAEQDIINLAMHVAERIVHQRLSVEPETLKSIIKGSLGLDSVRDKRQIIVRVHPDSLSAVEGWYQELAQSVETTALFFEEDSQLAPGDCVIDTEAGRVDARLVTKIENIKGALTQ